MTYLSNPKFLPTCMVVMSALASISYAFQKDTRHALYWLASAVLIASVTY